LPAPGPAFLTTTILDSQDDIDDFPGSIPLLYLHLWQCHHRGNGARQYPQPERIGPGRNHRGDFEIIGNTALTTPAGLTDLMAIGGDIVIKDNTALTNLTGLEDIQSATSVNILNNGALTNLDGLNGLVNVLGTSILRTMAR
jgi:hypothetical protein